MKLNVFLLGIVVFFTTFFLSGCGTKPVYKELTVTETKVVKFELASTFTEPCVAERPVDTQTYLAFKPHEKEQYLTDYSIKLLGVIKDCNNKLKRIREKVDTQ